MYEASDTIQYTNLHYSRFFIFSLFFPLDHRCNMCLKKEVFCQSVLEGLCEIQCDCGAVHRRALSIPSQPSHGKKTFQINFFILNIQDLNCIEYVYTIVCNKQH